LAAAAVLARVDLLAGLNGEDFERDARVWREALGKLRSVVLRVAHEEGVVSGDLAVHVTPASEAGGPE
jgi:hypothetical protein